MRQLRCLTGVSAALLLGVLPLAPLRGQQEDAMKKDRAGELVGAKGHRASGTVHIATREGKSRLHFTPDFSLEKGPDVYITLTNGPKPVEGASVVISRLTRFSGEQTFDLPAGADHSKYSHLVLWCRKYSVAMAVTELSSQGGKKMDGKKEAN